MRAHPRALVDSIDLNFGNRVIDYRVMLSNEVSVSLNGGDQADVYVAMRTRVLECMHGNAESGHATMPNSYVTDASQEN